LGVGKSLRGRGYLRKLALDGSITLKWISKATACEDVEWIKMAGGRD
jgi:hypothetical protein